MSHSLATSQMVTGKTTGTEQIRYEQKYAFMINVVKMAFEFEHEFSMNTNKLNQHNYTKSSKEYLCVRLTPFNVNIGNEIQIHTP